MNFDPTNEPDAAFVSFEEATQYLEKMCRIFQVRHLSYWSLSLVGGLPDEVTWIATYDPAYMSHYMRNYTPVGDPTFESVATDPVLIDWADSSSQDPAVRAIHRAAEKYGIAKHGLSYGFRDGADRAVMFSVNVECADPQWPTEKQRIVGVFRGFAHYFHGRGKPLVESRRIASAA
ncbi:MAG: autoinducer binding domain-containing protein [Rhizobiales bacterium]|nr:autoinducer binding domain-containing protein [Hyphomicrobiales bacterium]